MGEGERPGGEGSEEQPSNVYKEQLSRIYQEQLSKAGEEEQLANVKKGRLMESRFTGISKSKM